MAAWRYEISLLVLKKKISRVRCAHTWNIFQHHSKGNFVSPGSHVISSIYCTIINAKIYLSILSFVGDFVIAMISFNFVSFYLRVLKKWNIHVPWDLIRFRVLPFDFDYFDSITYMFRNSYNIMRNVNSMQP